MSVGEAALPASEWRRPSVSLDILLDLGNNDIVNNDQLLACCWRNVLPREIATTQVESSRRSAIHVSASAAAQAVRSGDTIFIGGVCSEPQAFLAALVSRAEELENVTIIHQRVLGSMEYARDGMQAHFRHKGVFLGPAAREAVANGRADFVPINLSDVEAELLTGQLRPDVTVLQCSPPDAMGRCNLGAYVGFVHAALHARLVIGEFNDQVPHTHGETILPVGAFDLVTLNSYPLNTLPPSESADDIEAAIAAHVAPLVRDGCTVQIGHGAMPGAILGRLKDRNDLGIHSELVTDSMVELMRLGVVNNTVKTIHRGKSVASFLNGTTKMFQFVDRNPDVELYPTSYVNSPQVIGQNPRVVAINAAIEVDVLGQVNAESIGSRVFSGPGGQLDFARGARLSKEGRSIVALQATAKGGRISRIVSALASGSAVTVPRTLVDVVATEYGIAELRGRTVRERAEALIAIAAPQFRSEIRAEAVRAGVLH